MEWILTICTWGVLGICSQHIEHGYKDQQDCYKAMNSLYEAKGEDVFLYITCKPNPAP